MSREEYMAGLMRLSAVGLGGTALTGAEVSLLKRFPPSGVILFERNVKDLGQLESLIDRVVSLINAASGIPPLIMADHEGGRVSVLARALGVPPTQLALASIPRKRERLPVYAETSARLRRAGVDTILFPLADVNSEPLNPVIGARSFGDSPRLTGRLVTEAVEALTGEGLITCLKHFPGHGSSKSDSHLGLPVLPVGLDELRRGEIIPFKRGIEAGAQMVMTAHVRPLERMTPASLDSEMVDGILRKELRFEGVIITDALEMRGAALPAGENESVTEAARLAVRAFDAGNDMLLYSAPAVQVLDRLKEGFGEESSRGLLSSNRMKEKMKASFSRVLKLRGERSADAAGPPGEGGLKKVAGPAANELLLKQERARISFSNEPYQLAAKRSVKLVRDPTGLLLTEPETPCLVRIIGEKKDFSGAPAALFIEELRKGLDRALLKREGVGAKGETLSKDGRPESDISALAAVGDFPAPAFGGERTLFELTLGGNGTGGEIQVEFLICRRPLTVKAVRQITLHASVVVVCDWPYAADCVPRDRTLLITRGLYPAAAAEVSRLLFDRESKKGGSRDDDFD